MALQLSYTNELIGATYEESYVRILNAYYIKRVDQQPSIGIVAQFYVSITAKDGNKDPIRNETYELRDPTLALSFTIQDCYDYLKTLPEFAGAVDV